MLVTMVVVEAVAGTDVLGVLVLDGGTVLNGTGVLPTEGGDSNAVVVPVKLVVGAGVVAGGKHEQDPRAGRCTR